MFTLFCQQRVDFEYYLFLFGEKSFKKYESGFWNVL